MEKLAAQLLAASNWRKIAISNNVGGVKHDLSTPQHAPGDGAKLLFDIETREGGRVVDPGVDRMWVIVKARTERGYIGVLDSDPGTAENLLLRQGDSITFGPEHIAT